MASVQRPCAMKSRSCRSEDRLAEDLALQGGEFGRRGLFLRPRPKEPPRDPEGRPIGVEPVPVDAYLLEVTAVERGQAPREELPIGK